jgi:hypothetical protein
LTPKQCKLVERDLEIMGDVLMADGLSRTAIKDKLVEKYKLSERQVDNILNKLPPGLWRKKR